MKIVTQISEINGQEAIWHQYGEGAPRFLFMAANGFPLRSYDSFLTRLAQYGVVIGLENRGCWPDQCPPEEGQDWAIYVDDLVSFLLLSGVSSDQPIIAIGHSLGATTIIMSALAQRQLFKGLVLVDPASCFSDEDRMVWDAGRKGYPPDMANKLARSANKRGVHWESRDAFRQDLAGRSVYSSFAVESLSDYVQFGLMPVENGFRLCFSPEWEAHTYLTTPEILPRLSQLKVPALFIYGMKSFLYSPMKLKLMNDWFLPSTEVVGMERAFHMVIQEQPDTTFEIIAAWLNREGLLQ